MTSATLSDTATPEAVSLDVHTIATHVDTYTSLGDDAEVMVHATTTAVFVRAYTEDFGLAVLDLRLSPKAAHRLLDELGARLVEMAKADTTEVNA